MKWIIINFVDDIFVVRCVSYRVCKLNLPCYKDTCTKYLISKHTYLLVELVLMSSDVCDVSWYSSWQVMPDANWRFFLYGHCETGSNRFVVQFEFDGWDVSAGPCAVINLPELCQGLLDNSVTHNCESSGTVRCWRQWVQRDGVMPVPTRCEPGVQWGQPGAVTQRDIEP